MRLLFVQTQAEMAGAQEISRLLGDAFARANGAGRHAFEVDHLFLYRKTGAFDGLPHVHFVSDKRPSNPLALAAFFWRLVRTMRRLRPDVVLTFQHFGNIVAAPTARLAGVPRVIANHVSAPATISPPVRAIDRLIGRIGVYDVITANSRQTWRDYQDYPTSYAKRLVLVPHGFADKTSKLGKQEARAAFGLPAGKRVLGSVARLHPLKRLDDALRILPKLADCHLAIAGQGPDAERLRMIASELGVAERVHFPGELEPGQIGDFLAALDLFVFPSSAETFGLAAVEAAQAGVPVVANDIPVMREVLEVDGRPAAVFVDTTDSTAFSKAASGILDDPAKSAELSRLGRALSKRHSLAAMVAAYRELVAPDPTPARPAAKPASQPAETSAR
ncbi:MAG: glycosyltransferase family 4 protein [Rhizobiaceae bacterium]|nr:glycosyltransferase family 4 protein [Rhizobiaceae bacterium]